MKKTFYLGNHEFVALCDLLKLEAVAESGGQAKHLIDNGEVQRNGAVETRKSAKIRAGETIVLNDVTIEVCAGQGA